MSKLNPAVAFASAALLLPIGSKAQSMGDEMNSLHMVLDQLYDELMPLCNNLLGVGQGIAGFATIWYIASRVWRHIANAEPIDFYPLFRPFVIGFAVLVFPSVIAMINGVMKPTVTGTRAMVTDSDAAVVQLLKMKEEAIKKMNELVKKALEKKKARIATKASRAAKEKRLESKKRKADIKSGRQKFSRDDF
jgi:conjugative transposon TraJ protein